MCYKESSSHSTHSAHSPHSTHPTQSLSEAERRKMLDEVEQQQQDFGIQ
jgi:hypothetical protein